jgi:hypothetical protein
MVASADRAFDLTITEAYFESARDWLLEVEEHMPDIFIEMSGKSDDSHLKQLHWFAWSLYAKNSQPIKRSTLLQFLSTQVPSWAVEKMLDLAERSDLIQRQAGTDLFVPRPKGLK